MRRSLNKEPVVAVLAPERRSLRHSKPPEDEVKASPPVKGRKSVGKKKEEKVIKEKIDKEKTEEENTDEEKNENKTKDNDQNIEDDNHNDSANISGGEGEAETSIIKPVTSKSGRNSRKRQASEGLEIEEADEKEEKEQKHDKESTDLKNGKTEGVGKGKAKKKRKPPTKKKKEEQDESEMWTPLEPLEGDEKKDTQKKAQCTNDRRKQALVERQAPAEPMLQKQLPRQRHNSDTSECEVLDSAPQSRRRSKTIVTVDIDDEVSETGSIQIVAEPDVDSVFDFKRLLIQYRNVNLPSSIWGVHKDPRNQFVSFSRFNPDYPETNGIFVDRVVVFKGSLNPDVFVNGERIELPDMFNIVETLYEVSQVIQFANNTVSPISRAPEEPSDTTC